jgi:hypothetical protein
MDQGQRVFSVRDRLGIPPFGFVRVTLFQRLKSDPLLARDWLRLVVVGGGGRGDAAEVAVLEAVAVSFQADDLSVVDEAVDHGSSC